MSEDYNAGELPAVEDAVVDEGTAVEGDENSGEIKIDGAVLEDLLCEVGYVGQPLQWDTFNPQRKEEHVYHHAEEKEPYGSLNVDDTPRGRTVKVEIKGVTADNLGVALALYASLQSLAAEDEETEDSEV